MHDLFLAHFASINADKTVKDKAESRYRESTRRAL